MEQPSDTEKRSLNSKPGCLNVVDTFRYVGDVCVTMNAAREGVKMERKPKLTPRQKLETSKRIDAGETQWSVARGYNVS